MGDLNKYFSREEFACKCGCGFDTVDYDLLSVLTDIREHFNAPVHINSACRCEAHNANEGGSKNSQHLIGKAADIVVAAGCDPVLICRYLNLAYPDMFGIGKYETFTHVDVRSKKARW